MTERKRLLFRGLLSLLVASSMALVAACSSGSSDPASTEATKEMGKQIEQADANLKISVGRKGATVQGKNFKARALQSAGAK